MAIQAIDIFPWNEHFLTGVPTIDDQHRKLVDLLNRLASHVAYGGVQAQLGLILEELTDYTIYHFRAEEEIWGEHLAGDPDEIQHKAVHEQFVETIERLKRDQAVKPTDELVQDTLAFLARWLASHILETDKRMAFTIQGLQKKLSVAEAKKYADAQMSGEAKALIDLILSIYGTLATNTVQLMRAIAEQKLANDALRASESRYHATIDASPVPMAIIDEAGNIIFLNQAFIHCFGYTQAEIPTLRDWQANAYPNYDYRHLVNLTWQHRLATAGADLSSFEPLEVRIRAKNGTDRTVIATASQLAASLDGQHLVTLYDITDRKDAENALRESERRFRLMAESVRDYAIVFLDQNGFISSWNKGAERIKGYSESESMGKPISIFYIDEDIAQGVPYTLLEQAKVNGSVEHEGWRVRKNGSRFFAHTLITAIHDGAGGLVGFAKITRDITEQKRMQQELQNYQDHLENLVQQRTADLQVAKEAAEAASRAKTAFLSVASHELRTPMNGIMGTIGLALRKTTDPRLQEYLNIADRSSRQLLAIINDVLDISRIESNRMTLAATPYTLSEVRTHVLDAVGLSAKAKGLKLTYALDLMTETTTFVGDPTRLSQVLINLVGNAVKFTPEGSVSVRVKNCGLNAEKKVRLRFEVQDTGIGIRQEDLRRIFEPFEQVDSSISRKFGGNGLGLFLCKKLVEAMSGTIGVTSEIGKGSEFWFEIQVNHGNDDDWEVSADEVAPGDELLSKHRGANVLLVEDEPINLILTQELLEEVGLNVFTAGDGLEAIECAKSGNFDLILMDMSMPNMDGIEATYEIRRIPAHVKTPIIALTANAFIEDRDACIQAGMNDHFGKPMTPETLYRAVLRWLDVKHHQKSAKTIE